MKTIALMMLVALVLTLAFLAGRNRGAGRVVCRDGTVSACVTVHGGCCSHHGGVR